MLPYTDAACRCPSSKSPVPPIVVRLARQRWRCCHSTPGMANSRSSTEARAQVISAAPWSRFGCCRAASPSSGSDFRFCTFYRMEFIFHNSCSTASSAAGVPVVLNQNGVFYPGWYPHGWERENARMAKVHAAADYVFYQSEFCRRCAEQFLGRARPLRNPLQCGRYPPFHARRGRIREPPIYVSGDRKIGASTAYRLTSSIAGLAAARTRGLDVRLMIAGVADAVQSAARAQVERLGVAGACRIHGAVYGYSGAQTFIVVRTPI